MPAWTAALRVFRGPCFVNMRRGGTSEANREVRIYWRYAGHSLGIRARLRIRLVAERNAERTVS